jgi:hypothetical protein
MGLCIWFFDHVVIKWVGIRTGSRGTGCCVYVLVIDGVWVGAGDMLKVSIGVFGMTDGVVAAHERCWPMTLSDGGVSGGWGLGDTTWKGEGI